MRDVMIVVALICSALVLGLILLGAPSVIASLS